MTPPANFSFPLLSACFLLSFLIHLLFFLLPIPRQANSQNAGIILELDNSNFSGTQNANAAPNPSSEPVSQNLLPPPESEKEETHTPEKAEILPDKIPAPPVSLKKGKKLPQSSKTPKKRQGKTETTGSAMGNNKTESESAGDKATANYSAPRAMNGNAIPDYPPLARKRNQEGTVILRLFIDAQGYLATVEINKSSGHKLLDEAALKAVKGWKFLPAQKNGKPYGDFLLMPIQFKLNGR